MCITEQTHESAQLHIRLAQEQDIILIIFNYAHLFYYLIIIIGFINSAH